MNFKLVKPYKFLINCPTFIVVKLNRMILYMFILLRVFNYFLNQSFGYNLENKIFIVIDRNKNKPTKFYTLEEIKNCKFENGEISKLFLAKVKMHIENKEDCFTCHHCLTTGFMLESCFNIIL